MWLGTVYLAVLCVFESSAVRSRRSVFDGARFCHPSPHHNQNIVLLSADSPRTVFVTGSYRDEEFGPSQNIENFREDPNVPQLTVERNPDGKLSRCVRSVKDTYDSWDSRPARSSKQRWSSRSARESEIGDDEDEEGYEEKAFPSLPKGRYLLIPTTSNLEDILKSKDPQLGKMNYPPSSGKQIVRASEDVPYSSPKSSPQGQYEMDPMDFQTENPPVQVPAFDKNCPHCNKMATQEKTMAKQPTDPKYFQQLLQTNPGFLKKFLETRQIRPRRFSGYDRKANTDSLILADSVDPVGVRANSKSTPVTNQKAYKSPRNVIGNLNKPSLPLARSKKSTLERFPKHILDEIQSQMPPRVQSAKNIRHNTKVDPQSLSLSQTQRIPTNQNTRYATPSQQHGAFTRPNLQTPSLSEGNGNGNVPTNPLRKSNLSSVPKGFTMPAMASNPTNTPLKNQMLHPNQETQESSLLPELPSSENLSRGRSQDPRVPSNSQMKMNPRTAQAPLTPVAPNVGEVSSSLPVLEPAPAPSSSSGVDSPMTPVRSPPQAQGTLSFPASAGSTLTMAPPNSANFRETPMVKNVDFSRQENTDFAPNQK